MPGRTIISVDHFSKQEKAKGSGNSPRMQTFEHFAGLKDEAKLADISCRMFRGMGGLPLDTGRTANLWH